MWSTNGMWPAKGSTQPALPPLPTRGWSPVSSSVQAFRSSGVCHGVPQRLSGCNPLPGFARWGVDRDWSQVGSTGSGCAWTIVLDGLPTGG